MRQCCQVCKVSQQCLEAAHWFSPLFKYSQLEYSMFPASVSRSSPICVALALCQRRLTWQIPTTSGFAGLRFTVTPSGMKWLRPLSQ